MLGPIPETLSDHCYVRSICGDFVMLGSIPKGLRETCYVRSISGDICYLR